MPSVRVNKSVVAVVATFAVLLFLPAGHAAGAIKVRTEDGAVLARYKMLDCDVSKRHGFHADHGAVNGWKFRAVIYRNSFDGFKRYKVKYGNDSDADFSVFNGRRSFTNQFAPKTDIPRLVVGGAFQFPNGRKALRMGFPLAYDGNGPNPNWVSVAGEARCKY